MWHIGEAPNGKEVTVRLKDGTITTGHYIGFVNKYVGKVDKWKIDNRVVRPSEVLAWRED